MVSLENDFARVDKSLHYDLSQLLSTALPKRLLEKSFISRLETVMVRSRLDMYLAEPSVKGALSLIYKYLSRVYRHEYIYKNEISKQLLLANHSFDEAVLLRELTTGSSIADVVIVNGLASCYEIKTELDKLSRLQGQLDSYCKLYDRVSVVTHEGLVDKLQRDFPEWLGISVLNASNRIVTIRSASDHHTKFDAFTAAASLRQHEMVAQLKQIGIDLTSTKPGLLFSNCREAMTTLPEDLARRVFRASLKMRMLSPYQRDIVQDTDDALTCALLTASLTKSNWKELVVKLNQSLSNSCIYPTSEANSMSLLP